MLVTVFRVSHLKYPAPKTTSLIGGSSNTVSQPTQGFADEPSPAAANASARLSLALPAVASARAREEPCPAVVVAACKGRVATKSVIAIAQRLLIVMNISSG
jgi:hypothetical protein